MTFNIRDVDLGALNSLTKYPSIPTYHRLDPQSGDLVESETVKFTGRVIGTEKVDGANTRIVLHPGGYILGSREEFLYASGDLIGNGTFGIVTAVREIAESLPRWDRITVIYGETFGGRVNETSRAYSGSKQTTGFRMFDAWTVEDYEPLLRMDKQQAASWREHGQQPFFDELELLNTSIFGLPPVTPRLFDIHAADLPVTIDGMRQFLEVHLPESQCAMDDKASRRPEGIVLRSTDRRTIAKARYADYDRTIRRRDGQKRRPHR